MGYSRKVQNPEARMRQIIADSASRVLISNEADTGSLTVAAGTSYARYAGRWALPITTIDLFFYVHGVAAVGVGWAEVAIATSSPMVQSNFDTGTESIDLTIRGYADIESLVKTASTFGYWKRVTPVTPIMPGTDLWIAVASSFATTQASFRIPTGGTVNGRSKTRVDATGATTRPSLVIGAAQTFTGPVGTGATVPMFEVQVLG